MGDITKNFSRREFACKCGRDAPGYCNSKYAAVDIELVGVLQQLVDDLSVDMTEQVRVIIVSGCRCYGHNKDVGGAKHSQHVYGIAADIKVLHADGSQVSPEIVAEYLEQTYPTRYGIGTYASWTHVDVRPAAVRWGVE